MADDLVSKGKEAFDDAKSKVEGVLNSDQGKEVIDGAKTAVDGAVAKTKEVFEDVQGKVNEALSSDKAEEVSDSILNTISDFAKKILPEETHAKIDEVRNNVDGAIGK